MAKRKYPERLVPRKLSISLEYMRREGSAWGRSVESWVRAYLKRNKIMCETELRHGEEYLTVDFPSAWRCKFFVLRGNSEFPHFEFL